MSSIDAGANDLDLLDGVSDQTCRSILTALCHSDDDIKEKTIKCLSVIRDKTRPDTVGDQGDSKAAGTKRKADESAPEVFLCQNCGEAFLEEDNNERACYHHPGYLEVDYEASTWDDFDEPGHGIIDSEESRKEWPEGFKWDCCDASGDAERGCQYDYHEPFGPKRQRKAKSEEP